MHIPDGLMDPQVAIIGWIEFAAVISVALFMSKKRLREKDLPRVAILSAGIFVAQMVNFPIGGGTTGHLIGGALFAILVGPTLAIIGMTIVLLIQALLFGDGGITAFGLNALNMAVIAPLAGWGIYNMLKPILGGIGDARRLFAVAAASWASVFLAACAAAAELAVSYAVSGGTYGIAASISVPAMLGYHAVIGIGEAAITCGILAYLWHVSPELFGSSRAPQERAPGWKAVLSSRIAKAAVSIVVVFALVVPLYILYASEGQDGLEKTVSDAGAEEGSPLLNSPFSYGESYFSILFAGILGFLVVALAALGLMALVRGPSAKD